jgi:renal tumor antigen
MMALDINYNLCFSEYKVICKKGEGTFSEVLKCQHIEDGTMWACKKLKRRYNR